MSIQLAPDIEGGTAQVPAAPPDGSDQWERELDEGLDNFPQHPVLDEEAVKRENWYPDRW